MIVTKGRPSDAPYLADLMFQTIRQGKALYTQPQRRGWAPERPPSGRFAKRLKGQNVWVARGYRGPVGFMTVDASGYIDFAYVHPTAQGRGVTRQLFQHVAKQPGSLTTHASLHAQPVFARFGFAVVRHEVVLRHGQRLQRAFMRLER